MGIVTKFKPIGFFDKIDLKRYKFEIAYTPEDAKVIINGFETKYLFLWEDSLIKWSVSKDGYNSRSGSLRLVQNTKLEVNLEKIIYRTLLIEPEQKNAVITINGELRNSITVPEYTMVFYLIEADGYESFDGGITLDDDYHFVFSLTPDTKCTFNIKATPLDAIVKINNVVQNSTKLELGTLIKWSVSKIGYVTKSGEHLLSGSYTEDVTLDKETYTLTVVSDPVDSIVTLNDIEQNTISAKYESVVNWNVSRIGHNPQSGFQTITENSTLNITLTKKKYTFTINPVPADSIVTINGVIQNSLTADYGTLINWSVTRTGYDPVSGSQHLTENVSLSPKLNKAKFTLTIKPTPTDAIIRINGIVQNSIIVDFDTNISWEIERAGYVSQQGNHKVINDEALPITMEKLKYTLTVNPTPSNSVVTMNGQTTNTLTVDYDTNVNWSVACTGYTTQTGTKKVTQDDNVDVLLVLAYFNFTITPNPATATVIINGVQTTSVRVIYGTNITWSVTNQYYVTQSGNHTVTADYTMPITLLENLVSVSLTGAVTSGSPFGALTSSTTSSISWKCNPDASMTTSGVAATCTKSTGFITGACRLLLSASISGTSSTSWTKYINYTVTRSTAPTSQNYSVKGSSLVVDLPAGDKLTSFGTSNTGQAVTFSKGQTASASFSLKQYV